MIVWDRGAWTADPANLDASAALASGEFKFRLDGVKLRGGFVLILTDRLGKDDDTNQWLLIHRKDDEGVPGSHADDHLESVKTGRTNADIAAGRRPRRKVLPVLGPGAPGKPDATR